MIEKLKEQIQNEDISLSGKDIHQEDDNSILNKSILSTDFSFQELVDKKHYFQIKLESLEFHLFVNCKSIKKIFLMISDNNHETLENNYLDYITCLIGTDKELDKQNLLNSYPVNVKSILEPTFYGLLNRTKILYIDMPSMNLNHKINKKIKLKIDSFKKIASLLNTNIFDMSDYIEIFILSCEEMEYLDERTMLRNKLIGKFSHNNLPNYNKDNDFSGVKTLSTEIPLANKCENNNLKMLDYYFNNVWNSIEKENLHEDNLSFSGTPFRKNSNEGNENKNSINNINNINNDLPNSYDINKSALRNKKKDNNEELRVENACGNNACDNICNIF